MNIYRQRKQHPVKWIIASVIFILVMTVTFSDVYGINVPANGDHGWNTANHPTNTGQEITPIIDRTAKCPPPPEIPEPMTLILMGAGFGALSLVRRLRKA